MVHHTPWSRVMNRKVRLASAVAGLTGRIETIVVLIPQSDRNSLVNSEEYHDQVYQRPQLSSTEQGQKNLLRRLQAECPSIPSA